MQCLHYLALPCSTLRFNIMITYSVYLFNEGIRVNNNSICWATGSISRWCKTRLAAHRQLYRVLTPIKYYRADGLFLTAHKTNMEIFQWGIIHNFKKMNEAISFDTWSQLYISGADKLKTVWKCFNDTLSLCQISNINLIKSINSNSALSLKKLCWTSCNWKERPPVSKPQRRKYKRPS